jgi:O-antigen/teichoic acid export membrane protein
MQSRIDKKPRITGSGILSIARNTAYLFWGRTLTITIRFFYAVVVARKLGPELYGLFTYCMSWYLAFLPFTGLGIGIILSTQIGQNSPGTNGIVGKTFTLKTCVTLLTALLCSALGFLFEGDVQAKRIIFVFSLALLGRSLSIWTVQVFTAYESSKYYFRQQAIFRSMEVVLGLLVLFAGGSVLAIALVHLISWWSEAITGMWTLRRHLVKVHLLLKWSELRSLLAQGIPIGTGFIFISWMQQGPLVLFRHTLGFEGQLGEFALVMQIFTIIASLSIVGNMAALPVLSRSVMRSDGKDRFFAEQVAKVAVLGTTALALFTMGVGPPLINAVFGTSYREAGNWLGITLFLLIPWTLGNTVGGIYLAKGKVFLTTSVATLAAVVLTIIFPFLSAAMGPSGAILATAVAMFLWATTLVALFTLSDGFDFSRAVLRPGVSTLLALIAYHLLIHLQVYLAVGGSLLVLCISISVLKVFTNDDLCALKSLVKRNDLG